jgi:hypothetical protein
MSRRRAGWLTPLLVLCLFVTGLSIGFVVSRYSRSVPSPSARSSLSVVQGQLPSRPTTPPAQRREAPLTASSSLPPPSLPPPSPPPPSLPLSPPTPDALGAPAEGRVLFATFATGAMGEFLLNWVASVRHIGVGAPRTQPSPAFSHLGYRVQLLAG